MTRVTASRWLLDEPHPFSVKVSEVDFISDWLPGFHQFFVESRIDHHLVLGIGTAASRELALTKACAELLERSVFALHKEGRNTSGWAAYRSEVGARQRAKLELLERDAFLSHFLTRTPFPDVTNDRRLKPDPVYSHFRRRLREVGVDLKVGHLGKIGRFHIVVCAAFGDRRPQRRFGVTLGLGANARLQTAVRHGLCEIFFDVMRVIFGRPRVLSAQDFLRLGRPRVAHHTALGLHVQSAALMRKLFARQRRLLRASVPRGFKFERVRTPRLLKGMPLVVVRATNPKLQELYFGKTRPSVLNEERLRRFSQHSPKERLLVETYPHFFG